MKKVVFVVCFLLAIVGMNFAQTAPAKKEVAKKEQAAPTKKDGTPDKRYKANKTAADTTKHVKKDGTPDKRYKENKKG